MNRFEDFLIRNICSGRISEIIDIAENFFDTNVGDLHPEIKADILCSVMRITRKDLDSVIANHSEVSRTIKGHAFEVVFDAMMTINDINCIEVGGDTDVTKISHGFALDEPMDVRIISIYKGSLVEKRAFIYALLHNL